MGAESSAAMCFVVRGAPAVKGARWSGSALAYKIIKVETFLNQKSRARRLSLSMSAHLGGISLSALIICATTVIYASTHL
jgi:hypothetical protein